MYETYKTLGYRDGFVFIQSDGNVFKADYVDNSACRWFSTVAGMIANCQAYGNLSDENGNEIVNQFI